MKFRFFSVLPLGISALSWCPYLLTYVGRGDITREKERVGKGSSPLGRSGGGREERRRVRGCGGIPHPAIVSQRASERARERRSPSCLTSPARPPLSRSLVWHPHHTTFPLLPSAQKTVSRVKNTWPTPPAGSNPIHFCLPRDQNLWRRQISSMLKLAF